LTKDKLFITLLNNKMKGLNSKNKIEKIIHQINFLSEGRSELFLSLSKETQAMVLPRISIYAQKKILKEAGNDNLLPILNKLPPEETTDLLQLLPEQDRKIIINKLEKDIKESVEILNQFDPQTAAGLMNLNYIKVDESETISDVSKKFRYHEQTKGRLPAIIVTKNKEVVGYLPGHELGLADPKDNIKRHIHKISEIKFDANYNEVIEIFREYPQNKIVVIGKNNNIIGIIYSDDVLDLLEEQESASLYDFAGVSDEETVDDPIKIKVKNRYKWLIVNVATAFFASFTVGLFDETISKYVLLAVYMPIVAGMGGNAAIQTLAVVVRGISLKQIDLSNSLPVLKKEMGSGLINGSIIGILVWLIVYTINGDIKLAFVLCFAMIVNLLVASFFGTLIPLFMKKIGKDPATSATIFITTATDVLGFLVFLGLATLVLV